MSEVKSFRLDEQTTYYLNQLNMGLGISERGIIEEAIEHYYTEFIKNFEAYDVITVDFAPNINGVNTNIVQTFVKEITEFTNFELWLYDEGDKIKFRLKEN